MTGTEGSASTPSQIATFTDGPNTSPIMDFTATTTWGDGTTSTSSISGGSGSPYTVANSHVYAEKGIYAVKVKVADNSLSLNSNTGNSTATIADAPLTAGTLTLGSNAVEGGTPGSATFTEV